MSKKFLLGLVIFIAVCIQNSNAQTVYFNGLGRALVTTDRLKGDALEIPDSGDPTKNRPDTTTGRRGTGGYTIFDLGVNAQPNENLRASAILRIKNNFGGFYGNGSSVFFRQLRLDGVIAKVVKYEIGDIDLGLTPYTLYNFDESYHDYEADVFAIRRSIVNYENFNFGNKWRVQGAHTSANFRFTKGIDKLGIRVFAARGAVKDILNLTNPDRINWGGRIDILQSKFFHLGGNYIQMFDLEGTVPTDQYKFDNKVATIDFKLGYENDLIGAFLYGETGFSKYSFFRAIDDSTVKKNGNFYDIGVSGEYKPLKVKAFVSYRNVSDNFSSPGAQTRRIYDYGAPALFPTIKEPVQYIRQPGLLDRISEEDIRNLSLQPVLMKFRPEYNNITPYGTATPNRKGISFGASVGEMEKVIKGDVKVDLLSEVIGEGTPDTRKFTGVRGGFFFNLNKLLSWEKALGLNFGYRYEHTTRTENKIDLKSTLIDAGINIEVIKSFDLIAGYKLLTAKGNEFVMERNAYNSLVNPTEKYSDVIAPNVDFSQGFKQGLLAAGIRYRFTKNTYFTAQGVFYNNDNTLQTPSEGKFAYKINQIFLNYTMVF